ncbi:MAG: hypothetical protein ACI9ZF_000880 [Bradyrhizobium sp.]|jgi:uncharacterized protein with HEPN domain
MSENRLPDYLDHIQQAAVDARSFVEGLAKDDFLADKRTQQAVIMSLIIIGEAATKVMDGYAEFTQVHSEVPWRSMRNMRNRMAHGYLTSTLMWCGRPRKNGCWRCLNNCLPSGGPPKTKVTKELNHDQHGER